MTACASAPPRAGFADVQTLVRDRTDARIQWNQHSADDSAAARAVDSLLAAPLTADAAVQIALLNNRHLQAAYGELGVAQADLVQAGLLRNPLVQGALKFGRGAATTGFEFGIVQEFLALLQRPARQRAAGAALARTRLDVAMAVTDVATETRRAYYEAQAAEQVRELRGTVAEAASAAADIARRQRDAGNITELDLATERAMAEDAALALTSAAAEATEQRQALLALMGMAGRETPIGLPARLPDVPAAPLPSFAVLDSLALARRLDLLAARQAILAAGADAGLARTQALVPDLELGVQVERDVEGSRAIGPTLGVRIPLFDQGQAVNAAGRARVRASQDAYAALAVDLRADVRRAAARMTGAAARATRLLTVVLPLRETIVRETQLQYNGMLVGVFQLLQVKRDQIEAGSQYVTALRDYWTARAELERAIGGRLPAGA